MSAVKKEQVNEKILGRVVREGLSVEMPISGPEAKLTAIGEERLLQWCAWPVLACLQGGKKTAYLEHREQSGAARLLGAQPEDCMDHGGL